MNPTFLIFVLLAIVSTTVGGLFALRLKSHLHPLIGLAAGLLIGVAFLDLLPEAVELLGEIEVVSLAVLAGFLFYLILERFMLFHACHEPADSHHHHAHSTLGLWPLVIHRAMDGFVIGVSFQSSMELGVVVSLAIAAHSFPDGVNAVALMVAKDKLHFKRWIGGLAIAILLGALLSQFIQVPQSQLGLLIAFVAGWFLYLGASDLLPESHHDNANLLPLVMTLVGIGFVYATTVFLHGYI